MIARPYRAKYRSADVYGSGHAYLLRHRLGGIPGFKIVEANDYLPQ